ncbi:hypothetical protein TEA_026567 [Camellia sinensis var. sinensis]|uniref:ABC transporter domain-containing protein n=1 Tax=Camellia sinensis var. sinensis TaxID=542762 RepID=A0A4V3WLC7_CAMSN|nr:hypothetical protein TEA_026567 [Camellia sinensis var. sinensis]
MLENLLQYCSVNVLFEQEPHLFHMDVKSNISYGCSRDIKQQDVEWAAKQANAHEFISSLPNGYETIVDDGLLSGGQKQRIAIARAIVRDPAILILDEATSALDAENEYYIARLLHAFRNDCRVKRTVIVIAHGLSTIKAADKIMVMDGGRVVEVRSFPVFGLTSSTVGNIKSLVFDLGKNVEIADHMAACFLPRARLFSLFLCSCYEYSVQRAND